MNTNYVIVFSTEIMINVDKNKLKYNERVASENAFLFFCCQQHEFASSPIDKHVIIIRTQLINKYNLTLFMPFNLFIPKNKKTT